MRIGSPSTPAQAESARLARIAWFLSFAVTVAVIAGLLLVKSAQASAAPSAWPAAAATFLLDEDEEEDEGLEFEESDEAEEEGEDDEGPAGQHGEPPEECGLRTARAAVVADESQARLRTQLSYTSFEPVDVAIEFRLKGGKGAMTLGREHKRLNESGVLHASEHLGTNQLARVLAARNFTLTVRVLDAPRECSRYFDRHLKTRHAAGDQVTWVQSDSVFGG